MGRKAQRRSVNFRPMHYSSPGSLAFLAWPSDKQGMKCPSITFGLALAAETQAKVDAILAQDSDTLAGR